MSVNPEDWDVDFAFPDFNLALFERKRSWCRNWIVTFPWKKIWSVFENFNADHAWRREWTGRNSGGFPQKINERILRQWQQTYLENLLCFLQCFLCKDQRRKDGNDFLTDTVSGFQKAPELKRAKTYSALSFDRKKLFQNGEFVFTFSETLCHVLLFSWANKNFLFWRLTNDCRIARPTLVSGPPN